MKIHSSIRNTCIALCAIALILGARPVFAAPAGNASDQAAEHAPDSACRNGPQNDPAQGPIDCPDDDGVACTVPTRDASGECTEVDECVETCRPAAWWSTRSGTEGQRVKTGNGVIHANAAANLGQSVIDGAGPFVICGHMIRKSDVGNLSSALEALCVRKEGFEERELFRQLVATAMNCGISEGGRCDQILERFVDVSFSDCNKLCAGEPVENGPSAEQCSQQLACFNEGGRMFDDRCALGTCTQDSETLCGSDYGDCQAGDCDAFADSCTGSMVCSTALDAPAKICPAAEPETSAGTCLAARNNDCTLNGCE